MGFDPHLGGKVLPEAASLMGGLHAGADGCLVGRGAGGPGLNFCNVLPGVLLYGIPLGRGALKDLL